MKQSEALDLLQRMLTGLQRYRTMSAEEIGFDLDSKESDSLFFSLWPWIYDTSGNGKARALLNSLTQVLDRGSVTPMEFYNFMVILHVFVPEIITSVAVTCISQGLPAIEFPEPRAQMAVRRWEPE